MSHWETLASAPNDPLKRKMHWDDMEKTMTFVAEQDVTEILTMNKAFLNADRNSTSLWGSGEYVKVASIPEAVLERWYHEEGIDFWRQSEEDKARIVRKLNDGEYSHFRTAPGTI